MNLHAFTSYNSTKLNRLETIVYVFGKYTGQDLSKSIKWKAVWDTGATKTCISPSVAKSLGVSPLGKATISTASEKIVECDTYCVDIILPNKVNAANFVVVESNLTDCDLLIGMDIIQQGDFAISNYDGKTQFSFRTPAKAHVDYVKEYNDSIKEISAP